MNEINDIINQIDEEVVGKFLQNSETKVSFSKDYEKHEYDFEWLEIMEEVMPYLFNIVKAPKKFIMNEEEVVKVELARKVTVDSIKHLTQHTNLIQDYNPENGDVKPSKILNINKEETFDMYENRFIYSLFQNMKLYLSVRQGDMLKGSSLRDIQTLKYNGTTKLGTKKINISLELGLSDIRFENGSDGGMTISQRVERIHNDLADCMNSEFYQNLDKLHIPLVRSPLRKTNIILKNPNFQKAVDLWNYMERNPDVKQDDVVDKKNIEDDKELKEKFDSSYYVNYALMDNLSDNKKEEEKVNKFYIRKLLEKFNEENKDLDLKDFKKLITDEYKEIKEKQEKHERKILSELTRTSRRHFNAVTKCIDLLK